MKCELGWKRTGEGGGDVDWSIRKGKHLNTHLIFARRKFILKKAFTYNHGFVNLVVFISNLNRDQSGVLNCILKMKTFWLHCVYCLGDSNGLGPSTHTERTRSCFWYRCDQGRDISHTNFFFSKGLEKCLTPEKGLKYIFHIYLRTSISH